MFIKFSSNYLIMSDFYVNVSFKVVWQFKNYNHLKVTKCKKIVNEKTSKLLTYTNRGFFIHGKYYKRNQLNKMIEKIPNKITPF